MAVLRRFAEFRGEMSGGTLRGYAAVFGQYADLGDILEDIAPTAFDVALPTSDARALYNHDPNYLLGRMSAGTARVSVDAGGLAYEVDLPDTQYAADLAKLVQRGDITGSSFAFMPGQIERSMVGKRRLVTHTSVADLLDVSPVTYPAYEQTSGSLSLRHMVFPGGIVSSRGQLALARHRVLREGM